MCVHLNSLRLLSCGYLCYWDIAYSKENTSEFFSKGSKRRIFILFYYRILKDKRNLNQRYHRQMNKGRYIVYKAVFIPMLISLSILLIGCNSVKSEDQLPIEMVAFNSLTDEEQDLIPVSPKDSVVKKVSVTGDIESLVDDNYQKDTVYSVSFNDSQTGSSGNLVVLVDLDKKTVVGKGFIGK